MIAPEYLNELTRLCDLANGDGSEPFHETNVTAFIAAAREAVSALIAKVRERPAAMAEAPRPGPRPLITRGRATVVAAPKRRFTERVP